MFNEKYGLEQAVLRGDKTRTWRASEMPLYEVGEIVAIKQSWSTLAGNTLSDYGRAYAEMTPEQKEYQHRRAGWNNKLFVRNDLMAYHIRITAVKQCRLQDLTNEECLREGVCSYQQGNDTYYNVVGIYLKGHPGVLKPFKSPKDAFFMLINRLNGWGYWGKNPMGYVYEFELVK